MPDLTPLDIAGIERDAAWFWIDAFLLSQEHGIVFDAAYVEDRLLHLRQHDPDETANIIDPQQWDLHNSVRYPYIEAAAKEIVTKMTQKS
ncbi:hypothetical protein [Agrobacterium sp. SORGH_AS 787]|uniref:hypothetical protein n=1 Tax=Agrobacterium sp. SORGH_AS 787 TaxID=3041775 RepID=UPI00278A5C00|nr:hypothetical protein [Rhizobium sp. SORGH_AS_0787]